MNSQNQILKIKKFYQKNAQSYMIELDKLDSKIRNDLSIMQSRFYCIS